VNKKKRNVKDLRKIAQSFAAGDLLDFLKCRDKLKLQ